MTTESTAILEWNGKEYELKYTFKIVRRLKAEGINLPRIFREVLKDRAAIADYGDDIAYIIAWLLRDAGCEGVDAEKIWRYSLTDKRFQATCFELFAWVAGQHFATSDNAPKQKARKRKLGTIFSWMKCFKLLVGSRRATAGK